MEEAQIDNQRKLTKTLKRCAEKNNVLNEDKQQTGLTEIIFHGHRIIKDGVKIDEAKVQAIRNMPAPTDVAGVKRLCVACYSTCRGSCLTLPGHLNQSVL